MEESNNFNESEREEHVFCCLPKVGTINPLEEPQEGQVDFVDRISPEIREERVKPKNSGESTELKSGIGLMVVGHLICCGLPLIVIFLGAVGMETLIRFVNDAAIPVGSALAVTFMVWLGYRGWRKPGAANKSIKPMKRELTRN